MAVKISKLWGNSNFQELSSEAKLTYLYLSTNPNLNTVGVLLPNIKVVCIELGITKDVFREAVQSLSRIGLVKVKDVEGSIYFVIPKHFDSIPKSEATVSKVNKTLKELPEKLVEYLSSLGISINSKVKELVKPTPEQVSDYALTFGYLISGAEFCKYYEDQSTRYGKNGIWVDGRGTQVRDWKSKLRKIWFKEEHKLKAVDGAPKGYETFFIKVGEVLIAPDGWKNGKPYSKSLVSDIKLKKEFELRSTK